MLVDNSSDLISVIVPVYKVEDYLRRCIVSILNQTYSNIEIILVDDGSPDSSGDICDDYEKKDPRVKVIHKKNGGLSDARNAGIDIAKGKYTTFLDSDDWIAYDYIETLYDLLVRNGADISVCNFIRTETEIIEITGVAKDIYEFSNIQALDNLCGKFYEQLTVAWGKLYRTELFKEIRFPVGKIHEDEFTTYKVLYKAKKIVVTTEQLLYYWQRPDSIMGLGFKLTNRLHALEAFEERADFFEKIGQIQLRDNTYKALLGIYKSINENIFMFEEEDTKERYLEHYNRFKAKLRNSKQSFKFKLYYETYFISPKLANTIEIINKKNKRFK
jgi:glycosyltransferase involved in cell wall biosynthesis